MFFLNLYKIKKMGCSSTSSVQEKTYFQQTPTINLSMDNNIDELSQAQNLIFIIIKIRNRIIYLYHKLIYSSAACLYIKPSIKFVFRNILYKISCDLKGNIHDCHIYFIDDPPFFQIGVFEHLSQDCIEKKNEMVNFIIELYNYEKIIQQIDKDSPQLFYLEFENKNIISNENIKKIHFSLLLFEQLKKIRKKFLNEYKDQINLFFRNFMYANKVNEVGREAYKQGLSDIYDIVMLEYKDDPKLKDNEKVFSKIENAKKHWEKIMKKDFDEDIDSSLIGE